MWVLDAHTNRLIFLFSVCLISRTPAREPKMVKRGKIIFPSLSEIFFSEMSCLLSSLKIELQLHVEVLPAPLPKAGPTCSPPLPHSPVSSFPLVLEAPVPISIHCSQLLQFP